MMWVGMALNGLPVPRIRCSICNQSSSAQLERALTECNAPESLEKETADRFDAPRIVSVPCPSGMVALRWRY